MLLGPYNLRLGDTHDTVMSPGQSQVYFAVEEFEALLSRVKSTPGRIVQEIEKKPWGERTFGASDSFGNRLCFVDSTSLPKRASS
jgi:predicted enzyme related to lactoylglutathione lyase